MPNLGEFFGIVFYMYREVGSPHHLPHVTAKYGEHLANYDIETGRKLAGNMPRQQEAKIAKILRVYKIDFLNCWNQLNQDNPVIPEKISFTHL